MTRKAGHRQSRGGVELRNAQRVFQLEGGRTRRVIQTLLKAVGRPEAEVSILLVEDRQMRALHRIWMGEDTPTDVLSFPQRPNKGVRPLRGSKGSDLFRGQRCHVPSVGEPPEILGDIVVSVETAARRAPKDVPEEILRYLTHGLLHLVGHDHVRLSDRRRMNRESRRLRRIAHAVA